MSWLKSLFSKKKKTDLAPLQSKKAQFLGRVVYPYKAQCTLTFNGKPIRTFESTIKAYSKNKAIEQLKEGYKVEVTAIHRIKH